MNIKIKKYQKLTSNKYKIILENDDYLILYEDIILKHELLLKKEIENIEKIKQENDKYALYFKILNYISKKQRTVKEIEFYLKKYTNQEEDIINIINKLKKNNYLNDSLYIKSYLHDKINLTLYGPLKIKNNLLKMGLNTLEIEEELNIFNKELINKRIIKYINKNLKNNTKSIYLFKKKMFVNLINLGYEKEDILINLENISYSDKENLKKEKEKLRKKYEKKYSGYELDMIIKKKLYEKGYFN